MNTRELTRLQRIEYANRVLNPTRWLQQAGDLHDALGVMEVAVRKRWQDFDDGRASVRTIMIHMVYLMLAGLTVENLLKSRIVKYRKKSLRQQILADGRMPKLLTGNHNLLVFAEAAKLRIDQPTRSILTKLSRATRWAGRYAFPRTVDGWTPDDHSGDHVDDVKGYVEELFRLLDPSSKSSRPA